MPAQLLCFLAKQPWASHPHSLSLICNFRDQLFILQWVCGDLPGAGQWVQGFSKYLSEVTAEMTSG